MCYLGGGTQWSGLSLGAQEGAELGMAGKGCLVEHAPHEGILEKHHKEARNAIQVGLNQDDCEDGKGLIKTKPTDYALEEFKMTLSPLLFREPETQRHEWRVYQCGPSVKSTSLSMCRQPFGYIST